MAEFDLIDLIRAHASQLRDDVHIGIGDDAALLAVPAGQLLAVSTDTLVAGVHFAHEQRAYDIGWKSLAVNLSDLAAMGATPAWATLALTLPCSNRVWLAGFIDGFATLAAEFKLDLVGGDITQGPLTITITVHGFVPSGEGILRSGARVGDRIFVTGTLGDAAAALAFRKAATEAGYVPQQPAERDRQASLRDSLAQRLDRPTPRIAQGISLRGIAHACIDVSDGLLADLGHICSASGVGAEVDVALLPASPALFTLLDATTRAMLQLSGGDDYELCFSVPDTDADDWLADLAKTDCGATRIGRIVAAPGVRVRDAAGSLVSVAETGWQHFRA